uniref:Lipocalin-like domain-containing protein n=1 Tax=Heterorhabditis bacteriophora TaxID=37862 RepID=A0A1I7XA51_HETBA
MNSTCTQLIPPICKGASPLKVAEQLHGEWLLYASDPSYVLNWRCTVGPHEMDQHEFVCNSESWVGECEREWKMILSVNAWGGFRFTTPAPDMPIRLPSELFPVGNLSATNERLILTSDDDLAGRRYSVWLRTGTQFTNKLAAELEEYCIWPLAAQIRSMEQNC